jgi:hypothetical protein
VAEWLTAAGLDATIHADLAGRDRAVVGHRTGE